MFLFVLFLKGDEAVKILGITGPTGAGKSVVRTILETKNIPCIDADGVYHSLLIPPSVCLVDIQKAFGNGVFASDGTLDRAKLGTLVFNDRDKLELLNKTVLCHVLNKIREMIKEYEQKGFDTVAVDAPTLIESGFNAECTIVISVLAPYEDRLDRIIQRDSLTKERAELRLHAQKGDDFYKQHSDFVIVNDKNFEKLKKDTLDILDNIK